MGNFAYTFSRVFSIMHLAPAATCLFLVGGCFAVKPPENIPDSQTPLSPVAAFIAAGEEGDRSSVFDPAFGGQVLVTIQDGFISASGKTCKRAAVSQPPRETEIIILCQSGNDWELMPRVWGGTLD
ncbi:MAG: hypothetical protein J6I40_07700 [Mailhella sp.]|nr:hypothetical protein [Mailhella sp.]